MFGSKCYLELMSTAPAIIHVASLSHSQSVEAESDVWRVMSPDVFRPIAIPFKLEGETQVMSCDSHVKVTCT